MNYIKCLSLHQPFATLIAEGVKTIETRSWATKYRGPLLIHAARRWCPLDARAAEFAKMFKIDVGKHASDMHYGMVVAVATLTDCYKITMPPLEEWEYAFGNYTPGRFGWKLANIRKLAKPILCTGRQGLFNVPDSYLEGATYVETKNR